MVLFKFDTASNAVVTLKNVFLKKFLRTLNCKFSFCSVRLYNETGFPIC